MKVTVQGAGVVGKLTGMLLIEAGHEVRFHDPEVGERAEDPCDVLVIATPCRDGYLDDVSLVEGAGQVVVRSTVKPDAFEVLPAGRRHHWPEFLTEATAELDARSPDKLVWGSDAWLDGSAIEFSRTLLGRHFNASEDRLFTTLKAAAIIKLGINSIYTAKVVMANALFDAVSCDEREYWDVCRGLGMDKRLTVSHTTIYQDGYRGAGGKCLPKDIRLLASHLCEGPTKYFLEAVKEANMRLLGAWPEE